MSNYEWVKVMFEEKRLLTEKMNIKYKEGTYVWLNSKYYKADFFMGNVHRVMTWNEYLLKFPRLKKLPSPDPIQPLVYIVRCFTSPRRLFILENDLIEFSPKIKVKLETIVQSISEGSRWPSIDTQQLKISERCHSKILQLLENYPFESPHN